MIHGCIYNVLCAGCSGNSALLIMHISSIHTHLSPTITWWKERKICIHRNNLLFLNSFHSITFPVEEKNKNNISAHGRVATRSVSAMHSGMRAKQDAEDKDWHGSTEMDLLVVGPGVLGRLVAEKWLQENPSCGVFGQTKTTNHHEELQSLGIKPIIKGTNSRKRFPFVIFCAPPSGSEDYSAEIRAAIMQWSGEGSFLFTSSSAVYDCHDNGLCFEDAASLCKAILEKSYQGRVFMGCDDCPLSREKIMEHVRRSGKFKERFQGFTGVAGPLGKQMDNAKTCNEIGWVPKYRGFAEFLGVTN